MKLDRHINPDGTGKYALVKLRLLTPLLRKGAAEIPLTKSEERAVRAFAELVKGGYITLGNESPGDQFFVMKYKDQFTAPGLHAYAIAAEAEANRLDEHASSSGLSKELREYANEIFIEAKQAARVGNRIPD